MFFKSIRFKITVWYVFALAIILSFFSGLLYFNLRSRLHKDMDDLLRVKAGSIAAAVNAYWVTKNITAVSAAEAGKKPVSLDDDEFAKVAQGWVDKSFEETRTLDIIIRIFDHKGVLIAASKSVEDIPGDKKFFTFTVKKQGGFNIVNMYLSGNRPMPLRTFTLPVAVNNRAYVVQVSSPLDSISSALNRLKAILLLLVPFTVFFTGVVGEFFARLALAPVDRMTKTIRQITAENLKTRVEAPDTKDEIKRLADTFNDMLSRLEAAFIFQRRFTHDISHELKTPLTILRGELEVALKKIRSPQEYESLLSSNLEEIARMSRIVEDLLVLARFDSRELELEILPFSLNVVLERLLDETKILAAQKNITVDLFEKEQITIEGDQRQISRVLLNLLDNAIKYTAQSGSVAVSLSKNDKFAQIEVTDNGIGISEADIPHIFDRFYRADKSRSTKGFGLGLSIAKSIIEAHKGIVDVKSSPGKGTSFIVSLPLNI